MAPKVQGRGLPAPLREQYPEDGLPPPPPTHPSPLASPASPLPGEGGGEGPPPQMGGASAFGKGHGTSPGSRDVATPLGHPPSSTVPKPRFRLASFPPPGHAASEVASPFPPISRASSETLHPHCDEGGGPSASPPPLPLRPRPRVRFSTSPTASLSPPNPQTREKSPFSREPTPFSREPTPFGREKSPFSREGDTSPEKAPRHTLAEEWLRAHVEPSPEKSLSQGGLYAEYCHDTETGSLLDPTAFHQAVRTVFPGAAPKRYRDGEALEGVYGGIAKRSFLTRPPPRPGGAGDHHSVPKAQSPETPTLPGPLEKPPLPFHRALTAPAELHTTLSEELSTSCATLALGSSQGKQPLRDDPLDEFLEAYQGHLWAFTEAVVQFDFAKAEESLAFWGSFTLEQLSSASRSAAAWRVVELDELAHQRLLDGLVPDPLLPVPTEVIWSIRQFAANYEHWLAASLHHAPPHLASPKLLGASEFTKVLHRKIALNLLSGRVASLLSLQEVPQVMLESWGRIDFDGIRDQLRWSLVEDGQFFEKFHSSFPRILATNASLHEWASWFEGFTFNRVDMGTDDLGAFTSSAKRFLLSWSFFGSLWMRDLTLRSSVGFGALHLFKLFVDELLLYILENRRSQFRKIHHLPAPSLSAS